MQGIGLYSVLTVRKQADNAAGKRACETPDSVSCDHLLHGDIGGADRAGRVGTKPLKPVEIICPAPVYHCII